MKTSATRSLLALSLCALALAGCPPEQPEVLDPGTSADMRSAPDMRSGLGDMAPDMRPALPDGQDVRIASFNVERLFDTTCDSGRCAGDDFEELPSELALKSKLDRIQAAIERLDADIVVFQEIENEPLFKQLIEPFASTHPVQVFGETNFSASMDVAVLARGTLLETRTHRQDRIPLDGGGTEKFAREFLEVHVQLQGQRVIIFGAHFISKRSDSDGDWRLAEGRAAGKIARAAVEEFPQALVAIAGDLNDTPDSPALEAIASQGFVVPARGRSVSQYYTHVFSGNPQVIDHVLYWPGQDIVVGPQALEVFRDEGRQGFGGSDHASPRLSIRVAAP